jgi:hypothetical protein
MTCELFTILAQQVSSNWFHSCPTLILKEGHFNKTIFCLLDRLPPTSILLLLSYLFYFWGSSGNISVLNILGLLRNLNKFSQ